MIHGHDPVIQAPQPINLLLLDGIALLEFMQDVGKLSSEGGVITTAHHLLDLREVPLQRREFTLLTQVRGDDGRTLVAAGTRARYLVLVVAVAVLGIRS